MQNYKTVRDKADEWNLSSRHVQYLCRTGKVDGAIKRAEVWFIPADIPSPAKKTKPGGNAFSFVGTKRKIFYSAITLFVQSGFDCVSLRDIGRRAGIRQSTIYNHFKSKQEILDVIYDYFCHYYLEDRPSLEDMTRMLERDSIGDILLAIRYLFKEEYIQTLSDITKIIFQRIGIDHRAREITTSLMIENGLRYVENVFQIGINMGRFAPFDTRSLAVFISSVRVFTLYNWIADPSLENMTKRMDDEQTLYQYAIQLLQDSGPTKPRDAM